MTLRRIRSQIPRPRSGWMIRALASLREAALNSVHRASEFLNNCDTRTGHPHHLNPVFTPGLINSTSLLASPFTRIEVQAEPEVGFRFGKFRGLTSKL